MAFEVIKNIVEAEKEAENIKLQAADKAQQIKADALKKAEEIALVFAREAKAKRAEMVKAAVEQSQSEVESILAEAKDKCTQVQDVANSRKDMAVKAVIRKVVGTDGDS
ncbi:MAG: hypothetical protein IKU80_02935 [Firmicutes bacterium]|nr:hypothetical protein [Bacillota bacterium]